MKNCSGQKFDTRGAGHFGVKGSSDQNLLQNRSIILLEHSHADRITSLAMNSTNWARPFGLEGTLQLGICGMCHLLVVSLLWLGVFQFFQKKIVAVWQPQVLVWLGIFQLLGATDISGKTKTFQKTPPAFCGMCHRTSTPFVWPSVRSQYKLDAILWSQTKNKRIPAGSSWWTVSTVANGERDWVAFKLMYCFLNYTELSQISWKIRYEFGTHCMRTTSRLSTRHFFLHFPSSPQIRNLRVVQNACVRKRWIFFPLKPWQRRNMFPSSHLLVTVPVL